ncbi:MAG: outer membrane protein transport protein [Cyclobacteriaceae bacterium]|nr:outer membrane protein transport protein [Cyclobacteriaceae bacterium]
MKFRVFIQLTGIVLAFATELSAQSFVENALLFSRTKPGGSARIQALGGTQVALGGDFSSALSNPAGLGMYNRSEFTFSPALNFFNSDASHRGTTQKESNSKFTIPGLSYVFNSPQNKDGFWGGSFGISMTRTNDFNSFMQYGGNDNVSSIIDWFIQDAQGQSEDDLLNSDFPTGLAYSNFLLEDSTFYGGPSRSYFSFLGLYPDPDDIRHLKRQGSVKTKGAQYQWSLAYGGNYLDKIFFGASVGITTLRYTFTSTYSESDFFFELDPNFNPLDNLSMEETIDIQGSGVNLTLGVLFRPVDFVQVGASFVTPTYYQLTDSYTAKVSTLWNDYEYPVTGEILNRESYESYEPVIAEYNLSTPMKLSLGTAFFISEYGFISGDIEFVNYRKPKYTSDISGISFNSDNDAIRTSYKSTINYRIGAEFRYEMLRLRAGYNFLSNPYNTSAVDTNQSIQTISAGVGVRLAQFFIDFALMRSTGNREYSSYVLQNNTGPRVDITNTLVSGMATVGFTF